VTAALELATPAQPVDGWRLFGHASIDTRPPARCSLRIRADGTWSADLATFTLADTVDLYLTTDAGGQFCGPAFVERSRADTEPFSATTTLTGVGPLLVVAPSHRPTLPAEEILEAEVVG
jgi:hypothetical protein